MTMRILVSDDVSEKGVALLREHFDVLKIIGEYDGLVTRSQTQVTKDVIDAAKNLKVIGRAGVGVDNIDIPAATARGIVVLNAPEGNTIAATEHTIAMMMAMTRHIPQAHASIQAGKWDRKSFDGIQVQGKTLGIIGVGRIGSRVALRMQAMEMTTIGYDPYITEERAHQVGVELVSFDELLAKSDYITIHTPLTKETHNIIDAAAIAKMKDGVRIVNCARGGCVDTQALADALEEPLTPDNNPFIGMPQVVQTPHLGASTIEAQIGVAVDVAYGVIDALEGKPVMTAVNMAPIPKSVASVIAPYFKLAERMGTIGIYLAEGPIKAVEIEYTGELAQTETQALTTARAGTDGNAGADHRLFEGPFEPDSAGQRQLCQRAGHCQKTPFAGARYKISHAPGIAKKRHLQVRDIKSHRTGYFSTAINVKIETDKGEHTLTGTLFDGKEAKIVQIDRFRLDFKPEGYLLLAPHIDKPNMIGQIATVLGSAGININNINGMQVGSTAIEGTNLMAIATGGDIPNDIMLKLRGIEGIIDVKLINCEG